MSTTATRLPFEPSFEELQAYDEYLAERTKQYRRAYYKANPEKIRKQRINSYTNFLNRNGYVVVPAVPEPWTDAQEQIIRRCVLIQQDKLSEYFDTEGLNNGNA